MGVDSLMTVTLGGSTPLMPVTLGDVDPIDARNIMGGGHLIDARDTRGVNPINACDIRVDPIDDRNIKGVDPIDACYISFRGVDPIDARDIRGGG